MSKRALSQPRSRQGDDGCDAKGSGRHINRIDRNPVVGRIVHANLNRNTVGRIRELDTVEFRNLSDAIHLAFQGRKFRLNISSLCAVQRL